MKYISLSQGKQAIVDNEDFKYLSRFKWYFNKGYAVRQPPMKNGIRKGKIFMQRIVLGLKDPLVVSDHINRNKLDNRKKNLRKANYSMNMINKSLMKNNKSGYRGVSWSKRFNKWRVTIQKENNWEELGYFLNKEKAVDVYKIRAKYLFKNIL